MENGMKALQWGETPWDDLSKEELLRDIQRAYSAAKSAHFALECCRLNNPLSPYWKPAGTGGDALEKCRQVVAGAEEGRHQEEIYRAFFRYADDLLFDTTGAGAGIGFGWVICPECGRTYGRLSDGTMHAGRSCNEILPTGCPGVLRLLTWQDLKKGQG